MTPLFASRYTFEPTRAIGASIAACAVGCRHRGFSGGLAGLAS
jgi:hypothetical protein